MERDNTEAKSIEDMWKVIESFGIKREIYELHNPGYHEVHNLYLAIKEKQKSTRNQK